MMWIAADAVSM